MWCKLVILIYLFVVTMTTTTGSIHSPFKQVPGQRLARGGLALAYGMKDVHAVDPVATSAKAQASADGSNVVVTISGVGADGLEVGIGREGFEVLGNCSASVKSCNTCLCWAPCNITAFSADTVTLGDAPPLAKAVRYLWTNSPCGSNNPYQCPVYAKVAPLGTLSGEDKNLPLGPFILKI
jgi:hypothetical protein